MGVDIGAGGIKVVELKREKNRPVLFTYGFTQESQDIHRIIEKKDLSPEALLGNKIQEKKEDKPLVLIDQQKTENFARIIREICSQAKVTAKVAVASLPVSSVFHALVTLPVVKKEEFDRILKAEVKKLLPYPLDEMALEYEIVPGLSKDKEQRVLVNAAPRALVAFYTKVFQQAGLKLESLEPESIALTRALVGRDTAPTMIIDIGAERTNFFMVEQAYPITHHSIELGGNRINQTLSGILGIDENATEQVKQDLFTNLLQSKENLFLNKDNFLSLFSNVIEPIIKEIEFSLEMYMRQSNNQGKKPEKIIMSGGSALFPYLAEKISDKFKLKCYIGDPWGRVVYQEGLKSLLRNIAPKMSVSIGLALRNVL